MTKNVNESHIPYIDDEFNDYRLGKKVVLRLSQKHGGNDRTTYNTYIDVTLIIDSVCSNGESAVPKHYNSWLV